METLFRRHFWLFHVAFLTLVAFLLAQSTNVVLGHIVQSKIKASEGKGRAAPKAAGEPVRTRDFAAANDANIFGAKREVVTESDAPKVAACTSNKDCEDGVCEEGVCIEQEGPVGDKENAVKTELRARLVGTAVFFEPEFSLASIVDETGGKNAEALLYSIVDCEPEPPPPPVVEGEDPPPKPQREPCNRLMDIAVVKEIEADRVYLYNEEEKRWEYLQLGEEPEKGPVVARTRPERKRRGRGKDDDLGKGITKNSDTSYTVTQEEVDKALGNLSSLATQARIVPAFEGGEPVGFKLFSIRPNSLYSKIGIQNGDVITRINGYEINSPDKALEVYQKLKDSKAINVDLKRRGKPMTLEYGITP